MRGALLATAAALASAANSWSVITQNIGTFSTGISFNADGKTGYVAVGANGQGAETLKSTDGGLTWNPTNDPFQLMVMDVTSFGNNVATMGALSAEYSNDGMNFNTSTVTGVGMGVGQCIRNLGPHDTPDGFAMVGQFGLFTMDDGVAISTDGGKTYNPSNVTQLYTSARYGSFPTTSAFFVSAGQWPGEGQDDQPSNDQTGTTSTAPPSGSVARVVTGRASIVNTPEGFRYAFSQPATAAGRALQAPTNGTYMAQIVRSTDGGNTWQSVLFRNNWAYLNGIDCLDANRCCVGAENDDTNGFAAILCTYDGGNTWNQTYFTNVTGSSILDLRVVGTDGYWAVGGVQSETGSAAGFLYSADAGLTWTVDTVINGVFASSVDCAQGTQECWATLLDVTTQEASIAYASTV